jgi:hypothetical protein
VNVSEIDLEQRRQVRAERRAFAGAYVRSIRGLGEASAGLQQIIAERQQAAVVPDLDEARVLAR